MPFRFLYHNCLLAALALLLSSWQARAVEIHTLIDSECRTLSGVVVSVSDANVLLIGLDGHARQWSRDEINAVVLHKAVDNPLPSISLSDPLLHHLYNVYLVGTNQVAFTGFPVGFIEELVVFFDLFGRTHVLALDDIDRMLQPAPVGRVYPEHTRVALHFPENYLECTSLTNAGGVPPARIIGDRVKVGDYFDTFQAHYLALESFRERTFLYAKPFLYDERTRLGLLYMRRRGPLVPAYIHWSTGRPYGFQSFILIGGSPVVWLPTVDPEVVLWSDLKSHLFHATFIANPFAIPAGTTTFNNGLQEPPENLDHYTESSFNYLILMGADYGAWSLSVGTFYPTRYYRVLPREQEVTATQAGLAFRIRATFDRLAFRALYFRARQAEDASHGLHQGFDTFLSGGAGSAMQSDSSEAPAHYWLSEDTVRVGATLEAFETQLSIDAVVRQGEYREQPGPLEFSFRHYQGGATLSREFGHYVRMNVHTNYHVERNQTVDETGLSHSVARPELDYGGAFEFQF